MASFLDLSISAPGSAGSGFVRDFDINEVPPSSTVHDEEEEQDSGGGSGNKKLRLSHEQSRLLEQSFRENHSLNAKQKDSLASELGLKPRQVEVWFQNRRARTKLKQTELECSYLRRCFGSLTEENKRLHREVEQLRALRAVGPETNSGGPIRGASTMLTMCPRCERVTAINNSGPDKGPNSTKDLSVTNVHVFRQSRQSSAAC